MFKLINKTKRICNWYIHWNTIITQILDELYISVYELSNKYNIRNLKISAMYSYNSFKSYKERADPFFFNQEYQYSIILSDISFFKNNIYRLKKSGKLTKIKQ